MLTSGRVLDNPFLGGTNEHMALQLRVVGFVPLRLGQCTTNHCRFPTSTLGVNHLDCSGLQVSIGLRTTIHRNCAIYLSESLSRFVFGES